jgi:beta-galactosidase
MHKRKLKAILGTCSYIPPQWLSAAHPGILMQYSDGSRANHMGRHAASRNDPLFRAELERFILAYGNEFKDHPAVIGWQLDNEIEQNIGRIDFNSAADSAWKKWLVKEFGSTRDFNRRLGLNAWGLQVLDLNSVPQASKSNDGDLPALRLAGLHFDRHNIIEYFKWQKDLLRKAGVRQWITTDWIMVNHSLADEPELQHVLDVPGINVYQPTGDAPATWAQQAMFHDMHRSARRDKRFLVTETRIGPAGSEKIWNVAATRQQFITWIIHPAAFGSSGVMHWSGNRFNGGHWPHWGGLLDWSGEPEPDFEWTKEIAAFYKTWGNKLLNTTVESRAAVLTDFDQRAALEIYPHTPLATTGALLPEVFDAFHRNGIGVDAIGPAAASEYENLKKYSILVIAAAPCLDAERLQDALKRFVENGGHLIVGPVTGYQTKDGLFRNNGFASDLAVLVGGWVRTVRLLGGATHSIRWNNAWGIETTGVGMEGFSELLELDKTCEVIASFSTGDAIMNKRPAATRKRIGRGSVFKFAFWPANGGFADVIALVASKENLYLKLTLPPGIQAVPRNDGSLFVINTLSRAATVKIAKPMKDRLTGKMRGITFELKPYELLWLEKVATPGK